MAQLPQAGDAQAHDLRARNIGINRRASFEREGRREPGKVAVGKRKHRDIAGRLPQIDRRGDLVEAGGGGSEEVHASPAQSSRDAVAVETLEADHHEVAFAAIAMPPMAGRIDGSLGRPTAWTRSRIGLPTTAAKPLTRSTSWRSASRRDAPPKRLRVGDFR